MSDKHNKISNAKGAAAAADEYQEVSYFAWQRGFASRWTETAQALAEPPRVPASGWRSF